MFGILLKQFFRAKTTLLAFSTLMIIGIISIGLGNYFVNKQAIEIKEIAPHQKKSHQLNAAHYPDDLAYALYYQRFAYINPFVPLTSLSIGQRDVNANILNIKILTLQGQKFDTDLINPVKQQVGNLDLSFVILFIFPLIIIALSFNILSEEKERGIWNLIRVQGKSPARFLLSKLAVRALFVVGTLLSLFVIAMIWGSIALDVAFISFISLSVLYILFWLVVSFLVVSFQQNSNTNAITLITIWLLQVIVLPMVISNYTNHTYPMGEALRLSIKQRDMYHEKWDINKKETMDKFYKHYPQFAHYGDPDEGFTWKWYYAMQQMGDDDSLAEQYALIEKVNKRQSLIQKLSIICPPLSTQLAMNDLAHSGLNNYLSYLNETSAFHEKLRLGFYDKIFQKKGSDAVDWSKYTPEFHRDTSSQVPSRSLFTILVFISLIGSFSILKLRKI